MDADDYHSNSNRDKMAKKIPLTDTVGMEITMITQETRTLSCYNLLHCLLEYICYIYLIILR